MNRNLVTEMSPDRNGSDRNGQTEKSCSAAHLLSKDLRFEHGGAKLATCPGRHLTSLRLCSQCTLIKVKQCSLKAPLW